MAISYPLSLPTAIGIANIEFRALNAVAYSRSPFTFAGVSYEYAGKMWQADITLPPMKRENAEQWIAWLISLKGQKGTFYLNDPAAVTPLGSARNSDTVTTNGSTAAGSNTIDITSAPTSQTDYLKAGDYLQIGTGTSMQLFKVLADVDTDGSGEVTIDVWPDVRATISTGTSVYFESAKGVFRLASNESAFSINEASTYGISFGAMEAA